MKYLDTEMPEIVIINLFRVFGMWCIVYLGYAFIFLDLTTIISNPWFHVRLILFMTLLLSIVEITFGK